MLIGRTVVVRKVQIVIENFVGIFSHLIFTIKLLQERKEKNSVQIKAEKKWKKKVLWFVGECDVWHVKSLSSSSNENHLSSVPQSIEITIFSKWHIKNITWRHSHDCLSSTVLAFTRERLFLSFICSFIAERFSFQFYSWLSVCVHRNSRHLGMPMKWKL